MPQTLERRAELYKQNPGPARARSLRWYENNKAFANARQKKYRETHREEARASVKRWSSANPEKLLLASARHRAKMRGLPCDLTVVDIVIPDICPVLGIKITKNINGKTSADHSPSVDRVKNELGYVRGNIVVVSWRANRLKSDATVTELALVAAFYANLDRVS